LPLKFKLVKVVLILIALNEECGLGTPMSNAEPENFSTVRKPKKERKMVENYFAYTVAYVTLVFT